MVAQAALSALHFPQPTARFTAFCWQSIALVTARQRNLAFPLKLGASILAGALVTLAITEEPIGPEMTSLATVQNETVVHRQARRSQPNAEEPIGLAMTSP